ncbi:regucalcin-like [Bradysia coprophila]|uniref:regucalcin-like n=1 Tax=Bradysia coprophila TaxID=38358 RepID=UPI00187D9283|nr:regucalcin-like [Bradysia coprophila]
MHYKVETASDTPIIFGESPLWDDRRQGLIFVDQLAKSVCFLDPLTREITKKRVICDDSIKQIQLAMPYASTTEKFLIGTSKGQLMEWKWHNEQDGSPAETLYTIPSHPAPFFCDGKCDSNGRFWGGTFSKDQNGDIIAGGGGLYRFQSNETDERYSIEEVGSSYDLSNGMAWNKENTKFYFVDFLPKKIYVFDFNATTGVIANRKTLFEFAGKTGLKGHPDGMVTDVDGNLWIACVMGGELIKIDVATGKQVTTIDIPATMTTSICFGGPQYDKLYVTTTSVDVDVANTPIKGQPDAGKIFSVSSEKDNSFKGFAHYFFQP